MDNPAWKFDVMPEIMDGKNIADFIDPDIEEKLEALEREEERLVAEGFYQSEEEMVSLFRLAISEPDTLTPSNRSIRTMNEKLPNSRLAWKRRYYLKRSKNR